MTPGQQSPHSPPRAEKARLGSINVSDHFHPRDEAGQSCFAWTWLAAARPNGIEIGTGRDTIRNSQRISADPEAHAKYVQRFIDLGFDKTYFRCAGPDRYASIDGYGKEVLPLIRERNG
jgi:alkanesulfonate monooxygenase SsuD/methylene tetrahydromethanopterin reductase-like flavin-dependent oxidoreductase (luciferase family)